MGAGVEYAKVEETAKYNEKEYKLQLAQLGLSRENLLNEYNNQVLSYQNSILSAESQKDSYKEAMDLTQNVYLPQAQANLESYNALLNRWDAAFTAEMTATKQTGQQNYEALLGNFANVGVSNAEAGREGATANLLENKQKQNIVDYVGGDMTLDENGGLFGMTATQQILDLEADKASYQSQINILQQSVDMYKWNLDENNPDGYAANIAEIDTSIENYKAKVAEFENNVNELAKNWGLDRLTNYAESSSGIDATKYNNGLYTTSNGQKVINEYGTLYYATYDSGSGRWVPTAKVQSDDNIGEITSSNEKYYYNSEYTSYKQDQEKLQESSTASWKNLQNGVYQTPDGQNVIIHDGKIYSSSSIKSMSESDGQSWLIGDILSNNQISSYTADNLKFVKGNYKDQSGTSYSSDNSSNTKAIEQEAARQEQERLAREEAARQEQERLAREEAARQEQERLAKEEAARKEQERLNTTYTASNWTSAQNGVYYNGEGKYFIVENGKMYSYGYTKSRNTETFRKGRQITNSAEIAKLVASGLTLRTNSYN